MPVLLKPEVLGSKILLDDPPPTFKKMKCSHQDGKVVGYLASSTNNYVWLAKEKKDGGWVQWLKPPDGSLWLQISQRSTRYLGWVEQDYAGWGIGQGPGVFPYTQPLLYNADKTISMALTPASKLYGPYGNDWVCWGSDQETVLVCELE